MKKSNIFICVSKVKKLALIFLASVLVLGFVITPTIVLSQSKTYTYSIVIDAGHGGFDVK